VAGAAADGGVAGVAAGAIMAGETGSHPAANATASAAPNNPNAPNARFPAAHRRTIISGIFSILGGRNRQERRPRDANPKGLGLEGA